MLHSQPSNSGDAWVPGLIDQIRVELEGRILRVGMSSTTDTDQLHLARAIELAEAQPGRATPNPNVGAVVVRDGEVVGEGAHERLGGPHAEVAAIAAAGQAARGAAIYVSLEPCCHHGKTPPCTQAILDAGIARVVVASDDPSEKASGRGLGILRDEGVEVVVADGELATRARLVNQAFRKHARTGRPWVAVQVGGDPGRQGRDVDAATRSGSRASRAGGWPTTGARRSTPSRSASARRWPTTRS